MAYLISTMWIILGFIQMFASKFNDMKTVALYFAVGGLFRIAGALEMGVEIKK